MIKRIQIILAIFLMTSITAVSIRSTRCETLVRITYQKGDTFVGPNKTGPWRILKKEMYLKEGEFVKTGEQGIIELTMPDNSIVRLAPSTLFELDQALFPQKKMSQFSSKLFLGRMWAKVKVSLGRDKKAFNTQTPTAIVGVRGTTYDVKTASDKSTEISVYEGKVGVEPLVVEGGPREEIEWPREVTEKEWKKIILGRLQRLYVGPDGKPGKPYRFDPAKEKDKWVIWNQDRDATHKKK